MRHRFADLVCCLLFPPECINRRPPPRILLPDFVESIRYAAVLSGTVREYSPRQSGVATCFDCGVDYLSRMASRPLLRQHGAIVADRVATGSTCGCATLSRPHLPIRGDSVCVC